MENRLTILGPGLPRKGRKTLLCSCTCGTIKMIAASDVRQNKTRSCGCLGTEVKKAMHVTHGETVGGRLSTEYEAWKGMLARCYRETHKRYQDYGGRGIVVCDRWRNSFENFLEDMGRKPSPELSIERRDNDGEYAPDNCVWGTDKEQRANKRNSKPEC